MKKIFLFLGIFALILTGCGKRNTLNQPDFVTKIDISCQQNGKDFSITYTEGEKIQAVLYYLRLLKKSSLPKTGPAADDPSIYHIRVHNANGKVRHYMQVDHRYLWQKNTGWRAIPAEQASRLYSLLRYYPTDIE